MHEAVSFTNKQQTTNANKTKSKLKANCRSTITKCDSKYSENCIEDKAVYYCSECKSNQCESCEKEIHDELDNSDGHLRQKLLTIQKDLLCQNNCKSRNYADFYCYDCKLRFCCKCYDDFHKPFNNNKKHQSASFPIQQQLKNQQQEEQVPKKISKQQTQQALLINDTKEEDEFHSLDGNSLNKLNKKPLYQNQKSMEQINLSDTENVENLNINLENYLNDDDQDNNSLLSCVDSNKSFLLIDENEKIQVKSVNEFLKKLNCKNDDKQVKCVSIFGNTGDGKSHTLNHTFFDGQNVFMTSNKQESCTVGVWCAYDKKTNSLIFDTEGLLGTSSNENKRMRLLLKILAISDVVIYRTRAERLPTDLFKFLADASEAYLKHFSKELKNASNKLKLDISTISPCIVIFHETCHTDILRDTNQKTVEMQICDRFNKAKLTCDAFRNIEYFGTRSNIGTDFNGFKNKMNEFLKNNAVRAPRKISVIFQVLKVLNDKFNGTINSNQISSFPDEYFTCAETCLACGIRCKNSVNHTKDNLPHENSGNCKYIHQYDNKVYVCFKCYENSKETIVIPKTTANNENALMGIFNYAMSGYVLECPHHGILYRSRQHWYGNSTPELSGVVRSEIKHVWPGQENFVGTSPNAARKILDGVNVLSTIIQTVSAPTAKYAKQWMMDRIAPSYWIPDSEIIACFKCKKHFEELERKHHCRGCGKGFCDVCSSKRKIIDWWSPTEAQRVCDDCFCKNKITEPVPDVTARKVCETVTGTIDILSYATKIPLDYIKDSARPSYWKPDSECVKCEMCKRGFNDLLPLHHCRNCGNGVCNDCSPHLKPVPSRGWEQPVRVCKACYGDIDLDELIEIKE